MRGQRALLIASFALVTVAGCCDHRNATITIVGSPNGLTGINGRAGDVLEWTTLEPDGPGYTVMFPNGSPCPSITKPNNSFHVAPGDTIKCKVSTAAGTQPAAFTYAVLLDNTSATRSSEDKSSATRTSEDKSRSTSGTTDRPFSAIPCRICGNVGGPMGVAGAIAKTLTPPDATQISCDTSVTPSQVKVDHASVVQDGKGTQYVWWSGPDVWNVTFTPSSSPCTNGASSFSQAGPTRCVIDPNALPKDYTYTATLAGCTNSGPGILTVQAPTPPH
jgi:hypothetical protein